MPDQRLLLAPLTLREAVASNEIENIYSRMYSRPRCFQRPESDYQKKKHSIYREALVAGLHDLV